MSIPIPTANPRVAIWLAGLSLGLALSVQAALNATNLWPANGATNICIDTPLRITFDAAPHQNTSGLIRIYTAAGTLVDTIDLSASTQTRSVGGSTLNYRPLLTNGNTMTMVFHTNALATNQTYYVTIDATVYSGASGAFAGITATNGWRFTTKPTLPPTGTNQLVIAADGTGDFCTIQGAVDFLPANNNSPVRMFLRRGLYQEIVRVNSKNKITLLGEDRKLSVVAYPNNDNFNSGSTGRAMVAINANDVALENLTLTNSTPKGGSQAESLNPTGLRNIIIATDCESYQDTLKLDGTSYFQDCYIQGDTDYIWGIGTVLFTNCETKALNAGYNCQARNPGSIYGEVFVNCRLTKAATVAANSHWLNRTDSKVVANGDSNVNVMYISCAMDNHIEAAGWQNQFPSGTGTSGLRLWEYKSTVLGTTNLVNISSRTNFSRQLSDAEAALYSQPSNIFGTIASGLPTGNGWIPQLTPFFTNQPTSTNISAGQTATFSVGGSGIPSPAYQWRKDGTNLPAATSPTLVISNAQPADSAAYSCMLSNAAGSTVSSGASLTVTPLPQPLFTSTVLIGNQITFSVTCSTGLLYTLQASPNLVSWSPLFNTNPTTTGFICSELIVGAPPARFYRILASPP